MAETTRSTRGRWRLRPILVHAGPTSANGTDRIKDFEDLFDRIVLYDPNAHVSDVNKLLSYSGGNTIIALSKVPDVVGEVTIYDATLTEDDFYIDDSAVPVLGPNLPSASAAGTAEYTVRGVDTHFLPYPSPPPLPISGASRRPEPPADRTCSLDRLG